MADEKVYERVSPGKVSDNIVREAVEEGKKLVSDMVKKFEDMGFRRDEVKPLIREGVKKGVDSK